MATEKQIRANQQNAQRSSGPKSHAGKQRARLNSLKHGVFSKGLILPWEDEKAFKQLLDSLIGDLLPLGATEFLLVEQMAVAIWKLQRLTGIESAIMEKQWRQSLQAPLLRPADSEQRHRTALAASLPINISRINSYQSLLQRELQRTYNSLISRQAMRTHSLDGEYSTEVPTEP